MPAAASAERRCVVTCLAHRIPEAIRVLRGHGSQDASTVGQRTNGLLAVFWQADGDGLMAVTPLLVEQMRAAIDAHDIDAFVDFFHEDYCGAAATSPRRTDEHTRRGARTGRR